MLPILLLPLLGTALGAAMVFLPHRLIASSPIAHKTLLGFASGVMVAASFWSLLQPALEQVGEGIANTWPVLAGFATGVCFLLLLDTVIPHQHVDDSGSEGPSSRLPRSIKMILAVALHNIPEGMAVGVVLAGALSGNATISVAAAMALSVGIAIQNFPEGAIVSMPLKDSVRSKWKAFAYGAGSGVVEPLAGLITILLIDWLQPVLPFLLAFAAGAMIYVVVEELIPESQSGRHSNVATIGVAFGFALMMLLDVALG